VSANQLQLDSFKLGAQIIKDGFVPNYLIALWRGGTTPACYIHELLKYVYHTPIDHIAIRTSRYTGIDETNDVVQVYNLGYLFKRLTPNDKVLIVDDVWDSGLSITAVLDTLKDKMGNNLPKDIRVATVDYKPLRNKTTRRPNYYVNETNDWLIYPHELEGLTLEEIKEHWGEDISNIIENILT
jgi:hypoxanthine phosphoribosyltransferase